MQRALIGFLMGLPLVTHAHGGEHGHEGLLAGFLHFLSSPDHALLTIGVVLAVVVTGILILRREA